MIQQKLISTDKCPIIRKHFNVSNSFANFLKRNYNITNKWITGEFFLKDFNICLERFFNENEYCVTSSKTFNLKLLKKKQNSKGRDLKNQIRFFKPNLYMCFLVESKKKIN